MNKYVGNARNANIVPTIEEREMTLEAKLEKEICSIPLPEGGNLYTGLITYFESLPECPEIEEDEEDEWGWNPWAVERADRVIRDIASLVKQQDQNHHGEQFKDKRMAMKGIAMKAEELLTTQNPENCFRYGAGALLCDRPMSGIAKQLSDKAAEHYGARYFIAESIERQTAVIIMKALIQYWQSIGL